MHHAIGGALRTWHNVTVNFEMLDVQPLCSLIRALLDIYDQNTRIYVLVQVIRLGIIRRDYRSCQISTQSQLKATLRQNLTSHVTAIDMPRSRGPAVLLKGL